MGGGGRENGKSPAPTAPGRLDETCRQRLRAAIAQNGWAAGQARNENWGVPEMECMQAQLRVLVPSVPSRST
jgi:hypothetical protein